MASPISITKKEVYLVIGILIVMLIAGKVIGAQANTQ